MGIAGYVVFIFSLSLRLLLLGRCLKKGQWRSYPFFFSYVVYTFLYEIILFALLLLRYGAYAQLFWLCYMADTVFWFAIAWEVFRQTFPQGSPLRRITSGILVSVLSLLALAFYWSGPQPGDYFIADFVRKIALSIGFWLFVVLGLARYYKVPVGRNVWGMAVGLLAFVSSQVANFAAVEVSSRFEPVWSLLEPIVFSLTLLIWTITLWSYAPNPKPVAVDERVQREAFSLWEQRWAALGTTIRKALKP